MAQREEQHQKGKSILFGTASDNLLHHTQLFDLRIARLKPNKSVTTNQLVWFESYATTTPIYTLTCPHPRECEGVNGRGCSISNSLNGFGLSH